MAQFEIRDGVAIIPKGTMTIRHRAFSGCKELQSVVIPESVLEIGKEAFSDCSSLESITIPESVTKMECVLLDAVPH